MKISFTPNIVKSLFLLLIMFSVTSAQNYICGKSDSLIFEQKINFAREKNLLVKPIDEIFTTVAKSFLGENYEAQTIENKGEEQIKVHLSGFDCYTFIETSLALARCICKNKTAFADFISEIENIRYRNGKLNGYASRLHYFSDWIYDLQKRGIVLDKTKSLGGVPYRKQIGFMSKHAELYSSLKGNENLIEKIAEIEKEISSRKYFYIPQEKIETIENEISNGDIIAITTKIKGLDISHVGIAVKGSNGRIRLLHAPSPGKKIQISRKPLADYIKSHSKQSGIMVISVLPCKIGTNGN